MLTGKLPRIPLAHLPTPLEEMPRLSAALGGPRIFMKRDDQTGLATGGNKTRKLEFTVGQALRDGVDTLVTMGGIQSNHCRQTAAAAARNDLRCIVVLQGERPTQWTGNLLLDRVLGAEVIFSDKGCREQIAEEMSRREAAAGRRALIVPVGASNAVGAMGFVAAMEELHSQLELRGIAADRVVFASSSFGTQAGLCLGAKAMGFRGRLEAVAIDSNIRDLREGVAALSMQAARLLGLDITISPDEILAHDDYLGGGYAVMGEIEREAIRLVARTEGVLLDPVYTGRAMAGLIDLIRRGSIAKDETVVFWHTGGSAALHAYGSQLLEGEDP